MSWAGGIFCFPEKTPINDIKSSIFESLEKERGAVSPSHQELKLLSNIGPFKTKEEAEKYLNDDCYNYYRKFDVGVRYFDYSDVKPSKAMLNISRRIKEIYDKKEKYKSEHKISTLKSDFVGCSNCKSKLKKDLLKGNKCPLCDTDLRSNTTIEKINEYVNKIEKLQKDYILLQENNSSKNVKVYWLISAQCYVG